MKILNICLIILIAIFIIIRFIRLDYAPPSLSNDEISIAYDAFSISKTLRDEHNHFLPISFQSHGTYKAPIAIYLSAPLVMILGNNDYSARLPSALFGSLTILALYLLVLQTTKNRTLSLLSAAVLAVTPLNIYTSRMALEANIALFFVTIGLFWIFKGIESQNKLAIILAMISFVLSIYSYHTEWGFIPIFGLLIFTLYFKKIWRQPIYYISALMFLILVSPVVYDLLQHIHENTRASTENILKDPTVHHYLYSSQFNIFQKTQVIFSVFLNKYSSYTNLSYIFFHGANLLPRNNPFQVGLFLSPFIVPFVIGLFSIKRYFPHDYKFVYLFLITSPIIPSLTIGSVNNIRNLIVTIPISIIISVGILILIKYFQNKKKWFCFFLISSLLAITIAVFYFLTIYFYYFPKFSGINYQYGYKQIALILKGDYSKYEKIIIDPRFGKDKIFYSGLPHLYIPYYTKLDPQQIQNAKREPNQITFDKYTIREIDFNNEKPQNNYLYISPSDNILESNKFQQIHELLYPDLTPAFKFYISTN